MGKIGKQIFSALGRGIGNFAGSKLGKFTGIGADEGSKIGENIGGDIGDLIPFKKGGRVRRNTRALLHKGEFVLPRGVPPTKAQKKAVRKRGGKM